jgi:hypothetical protein
VLDRQLQITVEILGETKLFQSLQRNFPGLVLGLQTLAHLIVGEFGRLLGWLVTHAQVGETGLGAELLLGWLAWLAWLHGGEGILHGLVHHGGVGHGGVGVEGGGLAWLY